jgi:hypothetical protein
MRLNHAFFVALFPLCTLLLTGCTKPAKEPDGTSGIRGICLLPTDEPEEDGKVPERNRWAGVIITASHTNIDSHEFRTTADSSGVYQLALNPGDYLIFPYDSERLKNKAISPFITKVEAGRFTELTIDFDQIRMSPVQLKK